MPKRKHSCDGDGDWTNTQSKTFVNEKVFSEKSQQAEEIMKNVYDKTAKLLWAGSKSTFSNIPKTKSGTSSDVHVLPTTFSSKSSPHSGSMPMDTTSSICVPADVDCNQLRIGKSGQLISAKEALVDLTMGVNNNACSQQSCHACGQNLSTTFKLDCHWCSGTICSQCTETCPRCYSSFCPICIFSELEARCPRCL